MSYTEKVVQPGETVRFHSRVHWIIYVRGIVIIVLGVLIAVALRQLDPNPSGFSVPSLIAIAIGVVIGGFSLLAAWWRRLTTEVAVTEHRIVYKRGFIRRHTFEMNMSKVESVHVNQSMAGRMFDYGDIVIRGVGSSFEPLRTISRPLEFRNFVAAG
jgi:membrane protein YdbS with pleckstrin-like domain